jgi:hypothetical protein
VGSEGGGKEEKKKSTEQKFKLTYTAPSPLVADLYDFSSQICRLVYMYASEKDKKQHERKQEREFDRECEYERECELIFPSLSQRPLFFLQKIQLCNVFHCRS